VEPPYKFIAKALEQGKVIPFLGSVASIAGISDHTQRLPDGGQLAQRLVNQFADYPDEDETSLTKVAQFCQECVAGRTPLYDALRETFYAGLDGFPTPPVSAMLASIFVPLIVTTNYDTWVERAFAAAGRPYTVLTHITNREHPKWGFLLAQRSDTPGKVDIVDPSTFSVNDHPGQSLIYKIHGTFGPEFTPEVDTIVITEDDYIEFMVMTELKNFPPAFTREFQRKHFLFLGYSLKDWNFRVILRKIQLTRGFGQKYNSWAIQLAPSVTEQRFWSKRHVDVFDVDLAEFTRELATLLPPQP
jgi:hypothetical protein